MPQICVRIDTELLRERLARESGKPASSMEVTRWLHRAGFSLEGTWQCDHAEALKQLRPEEILELVRTESEHGVTFVHREFPHPPATGL